MHVIDSGFDAFLDRTDIALGEPWKERLAALIATADMVVFAVSPDSIAAPTTSHGSLARSPAMCEGRGRGISRLQPECSVW